MSISNEEDLDTSLREAEWPRYATGFATRYVRQKSSYEIHMWMDISEDYVVIDSSGEEGGKMRLDYEFTQELVSDLGLERVLSLMQEVVDSDIEAALEDAKHVRATYFRKVSK